MTAPQPDDGRDSPAQDAKPEDKVEAAAGTAAAGLGCLSMVLMPWTLLIVVAIIIAVAWILHKFLTTGGSG